jgi:hypothetical protein
MKAIASMNSCRFVAWLIFDYKDGDDIFLRNIGWLSTDYTALYPRRQDFS